MEHRKSAFGSYLLLEISEWSDDAGIAEAARRADAWARRNSAKVRLVVFMIDGGLRVAVAAFPASQSEPSAAQVGRLLEGCSKPDYPCFDTVEVIGSAATQEGR